MATDDERREVAERLRAGADRQADHTMSMYLCLAVLGDYFAERFDRGELRRELFNRLADLIDPDCEEGRYSVARTVRPVDRGALLALADEIEYGASSDDGEYHDLPAIMVAAVARKQMEYARRIREALGVSA